MYGHLEGIEPKVARDVTGYLSIDAGIYAKHGLEVSWNHVQGTEERYRRLGSGDAQISFVVGRASLQHFIDTKSTRVLGCAMNTCPYLLVADGSITDIKKLTGGTVVCREGPACGVPLGATFQTAGLTIGSDLNLELVASDQEAFHRLLDKKATAAFVPRPYGFVAEEKGRRRLLDGTDIVDDPLPITIETSADLARERAADFQKFLTAHREGIVYAKANRGKVIQLLKSRFSHGPLLAEKFFEQYLGYMDESLQIDLRHMGKLVSQVVSDKSADARQIASEWAISGAVKL
jgi:ABC-type nitrate/sulfonate/bicarbonate transport system substrate-binding protein